MITIQNDIVTLSQIKNRRILDDFFLLFSRNSW